MSSGPPLPSPVFNSLTVSLTGVALAKYLREEAVRLQAALTKKHSRSFSYKQYLLEHQRARAGLMLALTPDKPLGQAEFYRQRAQQNARERTLLAEQVRQLRLVAEYLPPTAIYELPAEQFLHAATNLTRFAALALSLLPGSSAGCYAPLAGVTASIDYAEHPKGPSPDNVRQLFEHFGPPRQDPS